MKKPVTITIAAAVLIAVVAAATLAVLSAYAGEKSGLQKSGRQHCAKVHAASLRNVTDPDYGARLARLARCR
jgi:hypothetical protein